MAKVPNLLSLEEFVSTYNKLVNLRQMRDIIARADNNGAHMFIRRIGRKIFIDIDEFFEWTKRRL